MQQAGAVTRPTPSRPNRIARRRAVWFLTAHLAAAGAHAATVHVYQGPGGSLLITDQPRDIPGYVEIRRYGAEGESNDFAGIRPIASAFDPLIREASDHHDLDRALVKAVIHVESAFDPDAVSSKGAVGLMQLMAETAENYGVTDRTDPRQNLMAGTRHLRFLIDQYRDTSLALAAYNAGIGAVDRHRGIPPYPETRSYVRKVLHLHELYRQQG